MGDSLSVEAKHPRRPEARVKGDGEPHFRHQQQSQKTCLQFNLLWLVLLVALCSRSRGKLVITILPGPFLAGPIQSTYLFYLDVQICAPPEAQEASLVNEAGVTRAVPWIIVCECVVVIRIIAAYIFCT